MKPGTGSLPLCACPLKISSQSLEKRTLTSRQCLIDIRIAAGTFESQIPAKRGIFRLFAIEENRLILIFLIRCKRQIVENRPKTDICLFGVVGEGEDGGCEPAFVILVDSNQLFLFYNGAY